MFISQCKEPQKKLFLEIAYQIAKSDKKLASGEKRLLKLYQSEAELEDYQVGQMTLDQIKSGIKSATPEEQRIMALESLCMIRADDIVEEAETNLFHELFDIPSEAISEDFLFAAEEISQDIIRITHVALAIIRRK